MVSSSCNKGFFLFLTHGMFIMISFSHYLAVGIIAHPDDLIINLVWSQVYLHRDSFLENANLPLLVAENLLNVDSNLEWAQITIGKLLLFSLLVNNQTSISCILGKWNGILQPVTGSPSWWLYRCKTYRSKVRSNQAMFGWWPGKAGHWNCSWGSQDGRF